MLASTLSVTSMRLPTVELHNGGRPVVRRAMDPAMAVTAARFPLGITGVAAIGSGQPVFGLWLLVAFAMIDLLDGVFARRIGSETGLRRLVDVAVDRTVIASTLLVLASLDLCTWWIAGVFIARDIVQACLSGAFIRRHRTVLVGPHWHMSYGLSVLLMVVALVVQSPATTAIVVTAAIIAAACLGDFTRRLRVLHRTAAMMTGPAGSSTGS